MNNDCMNDEVQIDLIEMLKDILKNVKLIIKSTLVCGVFMFILTFLVLPKSYASSTDITIIPSGNAMDYTSYLKGSVVLNEVSSTVGLDVNTLIEDIEITRDTVNTLNYNITATTNDPKMSYRVVKNVVDIFESEMSEELALSDINIINKAQINSDPVSPNVKKSTLIGLAVGFIGSVGFVVVRFLFDKHLRNKEEVENHLGVEVLGEIHLEKSENDKDVLNSIAYRTLRTNIQYNKNHPNVRSICLTSANRNSGNTNVACNLAKSFAANHSKVLLIDANINSPKVHEYFNVDNVAGLTDLLESKDYTDLSKYTLDSHLYVIPAGKSREYSIDLLSNVSFKEFMQAVKEQFDFIVIDCPSLEDSNDVVPVSHLVDGTILVVSLLETDKNLAKKSVTQLNRNGSKILGAVLNKVEEDTVENCWWLKYKPE